MTIRTLTSIRLVFVIYLASMLSACGGGNGGSGEPPSSLPADTSGLIAPIIASPADTARCAP